MLSAGNRAGVRAFALALAVCACRTAPRSPARAGPSGATDAGPLASETAEPGSPQAGAIVGEVNGTPVLALAVPQFAQLPRDQRLLAYWASLARAAGESTAL